MIMNDIETMLKILISDNNVFLDGLKNPNKIAVNLQSQVPVTPSKKLSLSNPSVLKAQYEKSLDQKEYLKSRVVVAFDPFHYIQLSNDQVIKDKFNTQMKEIDMSIQQYKWILKNKVPKMANPKNGEEWCNKEIKGLEESIDSLRFSFIRSIVTDIALNYDTIFIEEYPGDKYVKQNGFRNVKSMIPMAFHITHNLQYDKFFNELISTCRIFEKEVYVIPKKVAEKGFLTCPFCDHTSDNSTMIQKDTGNWFCTNCNRPVTSDTVVLQSLIDYAMEYMNPLTIKDETKFCLIPTSKSI